MKLHQIVVHYLFPAQVIYIHVSSWLVEGKWLAIKENFGMESPAFGTFILINLSVRKLPFLAKKKIDRESPII